jgi:hypothetical protein
MSAQNNWRWCKKCQSLWFAGSAGAGACPAGKGHDQSESGNYVLAVEDPTAPGQNNWRWCNKCQALTFAGGGIVGRCPAGGEPGMDEGHVCPLRPPLGSSEFACQSSRSVSRGNTPGVAAKLASQCAGNYNCHHTLLWQHTTFLSETTQQASYD